MGPQPAVALLEESLAQGDGCDAQGRVDREHGTVERDEVVVVLEEDVKGNVAADVGLPPIQEVAKGDGIVEKVAHVSVHPEAKSLTGGKRDEAVRLAQRQDGERGGITTNGEDDLVDAKHTEGRHGGSRRERRAPTRGPPSEAPRLSGIARNARPARDRPIRAR